MKRRMTAVLTAFCMLVVPAAPMVPDVMGTVLTAHAEKSGTCGDNVTWTLDDEGTLTISGTGKMTDYDCEDRRSPFTSALIKKVVIQPGVTSIGSYAYAFHLAPISVTIPDSVTSIGDGAFLFADLTTVTVPDGVTSIGVAAFGDCFGLTSIKVSAGNPYYTSVDGVLYSRIKKHLSRTPAVRKAHLPSRTV